MFVTRGSQYSHSKLSKVMLYAFKHYQVTDDAICLRLFVFLREKAKAWWLNFLPSNVITT